MGAIQEIFEKFVEENFSFPRLTALLIRRKLKNQGYDIGDEDFEKLEGKLKEHQQGDIHFELDEANVLSDGEKKVEIDLSNLEELQELIDDVSNAVNNTTPELADNLIKIVYDELKTSASLMLEEHRLDRNRFEDRLYSEWSEAIDLLEALIVLALEAGTNFNKEKRGKAREDDNILFDALSRLHARGCQIAHEVLTLIKSGYADGAHARWRSLHEITVVASVLEKFGNELAEKYLLHEIIESYKAANEYQKYYLRLNDDPIPDDELSALQQAYNKLIDRFGKEYRESYGWAASALGKKDPSIADLEKEVGLEYLRPYYRLASHNVHANPKGLFFKLGLYGKEDLLLAGPSDMGLADPAQSTSISLSQLTTLFLTTYPDFESLITSSVIKKFADDVKNKFVEIQFNLEDKASEK